MDRRQAIRGLVTGALLLAGVTSGGGVAAGAAAAAAAGQSRRPTAEIATRVDTKAVRAGGVVRLVAHVRLPEGIHVQANKPRDPDLIPTVLSIDAAGLTVVGVTYPKVEDLNQPGAKQPLAVYPNEFDILVQVKLPAKVTGATVEVPATLRYQACNDSVCFPPSKAAVIWSVPVNGPKG